MKLVHSVFPGCVLKYRSNRRSFGYYVIGQMKTIAKKLFNTELRMKQLRTEAIFNVAVITYKWVITGIRDFCSPDNSKYGKIKIKYRNLTNVGC